jgi:hypothetical protein
MIQVKDLKAGYSIYGNKGNVWSNSAHIYKNDTGTLCGTPALSFNHAKLEGLTEMGCPKCNEIYSKENK